MASLPMRLALLLPMAGMLWSAAPAQAAANGPADKGAQIYCYMRSNGNNHNVSWEASYALIKRQGSGLFKTSPKHAAVMITEAVVEDPGSFPDCGRYLGDLFGESGRASSSPKATSSTSGSSDTSGSEEIPNWDADDRYSY